MQQNKAQLLGTCKKPQHDKNRKTCFALLFTFYFPEKPMQYYDATTDQKIQQVTQERGRETTRAPCGTMLSMLSTVKEKHKRNIFSALSHPPYRTQTKIRPPSIVHAASLHTSFKVITASSYSKRQKTSATGACSRLTSETDTIDNIVQTQLRQVRHWQPSTDPVYLQAA